MRRKMYILITAFIFLISSTVLADRIYEKIDALRNAITINVNGQKVTVDNFLIEKTCAA